MKPCPHCRAELRDSVIRCTRCGRSLLGDEEPDGVASASGSLAVASVGEPARSAAPTAAPVRPAAPPPGAWVTSPTRVAGRPPTSLPDHVTRRALPTDRRPSARPDVAMLLAAVVAIGAAVLAWQSTAAQWVTLAITDTSQLPDPVLVGTLTLPGTAALVGTIGQGLAAGLGVLGLLWFFYGWDRGWTMPWFSSPGLAVVITLGGMAIIGLSSGLWFVWEQAAVDHARAIRLSGAELRELLDLQPAPIVAIERLSGLVRYGGIMAAGFLASCTAWWAYRRRD